VENKYLCVHFSKKSDEDETLRREGKWEIKHVKFNFSAVGGVFSFDYHNSRQQQCQDL
jgi:hypothetical protein